MMFQKAIKAKSKLRLAVFGPSGAGKTFTSLRMATGIGGKIALIDSERNSASKYADRFDFDTASLDRKTIDEYISYMTGAAKTGYNVLIIDSMSHAWQELLEEIDKLASTKYKGNTWSAWSEGTPKQKRFVDAILNFPGHVIVTMRSKTEWTTESDKNGKSRPIRVGLTPEQGKGIEYEFDMLIELSTEHIAQVIKDRTGKYQDQIIEKPGEQFGKDLIDWLNDGTEPIQQPAQPEPQKPTPPPVQSNVLPKQLASEDQLTRIGDLLREEDFLTIETVSTTRDYLKKHPQPTAEAAIRIIRKLEEEIGKNRETVTDGQPDDSQSFEALFGGKP
ncbi:MAG: ATP-binding protein [Bacteroidetes bacterium]|nr:ATP-binding protein [Bacteroidota bacterium]